MTSRHLRWLEVTLKWRHFTVSHLEVAVEGQKLAYTVPLTSYKAVARRRRQSSDWKWRHVTSGNRKLPGSYVIWPEAPGSDCRRTKSCVYCTFPFLQGCSSQQEAVTWQEMTSHDLRWPEVTQKWRHLTGSYLEVAVEGQKPTDIVHFIFYKAVARSRRQSRDRRWRHVTSGDRKWFGSFVIWPEVTWK